MNYVQISYTYLSELLNIENIFVKTNNQTLKLFYFSASFIIQVFLCVFSKKVSKLQIISITATVSISIIIFATAVQAIVKMDKILLEKKLNFDAIFIGTHKEIPEKLFEYMSGGICFLYGFFCHTQFPSCLGYLENKNEEQTKSVMNFSMVLRGYG